MNRYAALSLAMLAMLALGACTKQNNRALQGWVEGEMIFVSPDEQGRVETLNVREGDRVQKGKLLFTLDDDLQKADVAVKKAPARACPGSRAPAGKLEAFVLDQGRGIGRDPGLLDATLAAVVEAARAIHDLPIAAAMPALAALLDRAKSAPRPLLRRAITCATGYSSVRIFCWSNAI